MKLFLLAFALAAQQPQADTFCSDIRALAVGAEEAQPFATLLSRGFAPRLLRAPCSYSDAKVYACAQQFSRQDESDEFYARAIQACLPGSRLSREIVHLTEQWTVRSGAFEAGVTSHGGAGHHVGRTIEIHIGAQGRQSRRQGKE